MIETITMDRYGVPRYGDASASFVSGAAHAAGKHSIGQNAVDFRTALTLDEQSELEKLCERIDARSRSEIAEGLK